ncbi:NAD(P)-binding protein [Algoriphagus confluentis]|uniref:Uncharacterized protein n=1 Tax=Algoriphagus confluentis TaxID=1697556 RepID=A0ABQ6PTW4_9BACT|nr:hypothetical protein Aconfl_33430 [Algoriphagus confluentis]
MKSVYVVIVIGSGPNRLGAAIQLQVLGLHVLVVEALPRVGVGSRTKDLTLPGFSHDLCSAFYPMGISSPFPSQIPLEKFGLGLSGGGCRTSI